MSTNMDRTSTIEDVLIADMRVSEKAQRSYDQGITDMIVAAFDADAFGYPVINERDDGILWIVDGQHRIAAVASVYGDEISIPCEVYHGLTEAEEAELFLQRDNRRAITSFDKFRIGVAAGRKTETEINTILEACGLHIARGPGQHSVMAVQALRRVYQVGGEVVLARTLAVLRDSYGKAGYQSSFVHGMGLVFSRYNDKVDMDQMVERLLAVRGGATHINNRARQFQIQAGYALPLCYAAAIVETYNTGKEGKKLTPFFKAEAKAAAGR